MKQSPFEMFLDRLDPASREHQLGFFRIMAAAGPDALEDLTERLVRVSCPLGLKQLAVEFGYYFPWPEWSPILDRLLRHEKSLPVFETGVRALGRIGTPEALETLRTLSLSRATPAYRQLVDQALRESDPAEAFQHHFARLLQGSANPGEANEGARQLARLLGPGALEPLKAGVSHPDPLVFRHALRLICQLADQEAAAYLLDYFRDIQLDAQEDREARSLLTAFRGMPRPEVQAKAQQVLAARWEGREPQAVAALARAEETQAAATRLRVAGTHIMDALLVDTYLAALDEKPAHLARFLTQAGEAAHHRTRRLDFALQTAAEGLADLACLGHIEPAQVMPVLAEALGSGSANAGTAGALARLVTARDQALLELLLGQPEGALRMAALEALGARKEPDLRPALLKLRRDAITDVAERCLWHLGQLPDAEDTARSLLKGPDPAETRVALRFIGMHRLAGLVPDLLELAATEPREELCFALYATLGQIGSAVAVEPLLTFLRTALTSAAQVAIATALRDLGDAAGAVALCGRAEEVKHPELCTVAVEALARAHGDPGHPLPASASHLLATLTHLAWEARNPWPFRPRLAEALVAIHGPSRSFWMEIACMIQNTLAEKRSPMALSTEDAARLQACSRALAQKAQG